MVMVGLGTGIVPRQILASSLTPNLYHFGCLGHDFGFDLSAFAVSLPEFEAPIRSFMQDRNFKSLPGLAGLAT